MESSQNNTCSELQAILSREVKFHTIKFCLKGNMNHPFDQDIHTVFAILTSQSLSSHLSYQSDHHKMVVIEFENTNFIQ